MGSRGVDYAELDDEENRYYMTEEQWFDAEILVGKDKRHHSLPEVSHKADVIYIKLDKNGIFHEMRIYRNHRCILEVGYHGEHQLTGNYADVLHAHDINGQDYKKHPSARYLTKDEIARYEKYFVNLDLKEVQWF